MQGDVENPEIRNHGLYFPRAPTVCCGGNQTHSLRVCPIEGCEKSYHRGTTNMLGKCVVPFSLGYLEGLPVESGILIELKNNLYFEKLYS